MTVAGTTLQSAVALLEAIDARQLTVHYQAVYALPALDVCGFEALVRWEHPTRGRLLPESFLPPDMDGGLGWALTNYVLEEAIRACAGWQRDGIAGGVSVNISPGRLADEVLPDQLSGLLRHHELDPHCLTVEVTESRCSADPEGVRRALVALSRLGVRISLDDFGTGDSSLARLKDLHFDEVKIDRCFVEGVATDPTDRHIVQYTTALAHSLGMKVVAEGVETDACLSALAALEVDTVQGFLLHRPEPASRQGPWQPPAARRT